MRTESSAALKFLYPVVVRVTGLSGVMLLIFTFLIFPRSRNTMELDEEVQIIIEQIDIPQTEQFDQPPPHHPKGHESSLFLMMTLPSH